MEGFINDKKIIFAMVGLPARGKTYISQKIVCYLSWLGFKAKLFNIGSYRRQNYGTKECTADFFNPENEQALEARRECAKLALRDLVTFLQEGGDIAVYDGTNTTKDRRIMVAEYLEKELGSHSLVWIESICTDQRIIENNIRATKLSSPDYKGIDKAIAIQDFKRRIEQYSKVYQELSTELDGEDVSFIKLYNVTNRIIMNQITGYIESKLVSFLMNLHITPRSIYFVRHGESLYNPEDRVGGDPDLSERGYAYLPRLKQFFKEELRVGQVGQSTKLLTSTLKRARLTADAIEIGVKPVSLKTLDELDAGICNDLNYDEIANIYPKDFQARREDKLNYRYPMGESYRDLIQRVEPLIFSIERSKDPVILVGHRAVIRCIYGYFTRQQINEVPHIDIPLSTIIKIDPEAYLSNEQRFDLDNVNYDQPESSQDF